MRGAAMILSAAASGFVLFLLLLSVAQGQHNYGVTYTSLEICAFKGSTVDIGCSFKQPFKLLKKVWLTEGNEYNPDDLKKDSGRVSYSPYWKSCTLTIRDLRESDSAVYKFRFETDRGGFTGLPGVTLTVTALKIRVDTSSYSDWATLSCQSSCQLYNRPSYIWYKNGQKISTRNQHWYKDYLKSTDSYSCAVRGHEASASPSVCVRGDSCNRVNYSKRSICAVKGSSVDISCTYNSYESQIQSKSWFSSGRGSEDLREDSQYAGRVEVTETERGRSTLTIRDLTESDSAEYHFKFKTKSFEWKSSVPGTALTVTDVQVGLSTGRQLDCVIRCNPYVSSYVWYKNGQQMHGGNHYVSSRDYESSFSCALKGFEDFHSPFVCVNGERCNRVNYSKRSICAAKGSSVDISCTYNSYESPIQSTSWFSSARGSEDLREEGRVEVTETERGRSTLTIRDLTESDSAEYHFKFKTRSFEWKSSLPGTALTVTALQVKVSRIISVHESQTEAELKCESSCSPAARLSYVWFKNNQFMVEQSSYQDLFNPGDIISCAFKGHEDHRSDTVSIPEVRSVSVSPSAEIVEGTSVTLTCSSDANPAAKYTWYKDKQLINTEQRIIFSSIQSSDSGEYYCTAEKELGKWPVIEHFSIKVNYPSKLPSVTVSPSAEMAEGSPVTLTSRTVSCCPDIRNNKDSRGKPAAVASIAVLFLAIIIICGIIFIRRKGCFKTNSPRERPDNKPEENAYYYMFDPAPSGRPKHDGRSAPAQSTATEEQQDDLCYASVTFIKKPEEHDYYNILPIKTKRRKERDEDVDYTLVRLNSTQRSRDQQTAENSSALYSRVRKK